MASPEGLPAVYPIAACNAASTAAPTAGGPPENIALGPDGEAGQIGEDLGGTKQPRN
jgi:hypothetical protein